MPPSYCYSVLDNVEIGLEHRFEKKANTAITLTGYTRNNQKVGVDVWLGSKPILFAVVSLYYLFSTWLLYYVLYIATRTYILPFWSILDLTQVPIIGIRRGSSLVALVTILI
jgi:hypothetical protein